MKKNLAIYGRYKKVRNEAWELIASLGLEQECIVRQAFAIHLIDTDEWYIFYDCHLSPRRLIKFYLAHELGHILLGHEMGTLNIENRNVVFSKNNQI